MIGVVVSRADEASVAIGDALTETGAWAVRTDESRPDGAGGGEYYRATDAPVELRWFDDLHLDLTHPEAAFTDPDAVVFASRHSGDTGPLLTCHPTGNFGPAEYGGRDRAFAPAAPGLQRALVAGFDAHAPADYAVGIECTHHGPTEVAVPSIFAELGSSESAWRDPEGARAVARAIRELPDRDATPAVGDPADPRHLLGVGDGHYAPRFERILRETPWGVGHVAADWQLDELGDPATHADTLARAADASDARFAVFAGDYPAVHEALPADVRVVSETWVREVGDRPLDRVERLEREVTTVAEGLRFGDRRSDAWTVRPLPAAAVETALGVDADATRRAVAAHTVAFEAAENGTRPAGRGAFPDDSTDSTDSTDGGSSDATDTDEPTAIPAYDALIDALAEVLRDRYETVERRDGELVAERTAFDPAAAAEAGVPEGPKFGKLANGQPVEVDGERVDP
ncbi:MAG: D-aminoacyl-tRNA deacylase, partial [Halobaculum sp.]